MDSPTERTGGLKKVKKGSGKKNQNHEKSNVQGVCGEAERLDEFSTHVEHVEEPVLLFGVAPQAVFKMINGWMKNEELKKDNGRHPSRKEAVLVAGVISYPHKLGIDALNDPDFIRWTEATEKYLSKTYGEALQTIILHLDEGNPHVHFFAVNKPIENVWNPIDGISCTHDIEKKLCAENGGRDWRRKNGRAVIEAQTQALKDLQTGFFTEVSQHFAHERDIGARKRRFKIPPAVARLMSDSLSKATALMSDLQEEKLRLEKKEFELSQKEGSLLETAQSLKLKALKTYSLDQKMLSKTKAAEELLEELEKVLTEAHKRRDLEAVKVLKPKIDAFKKQLDELKPKPPSGPVFQSR